MRILVEGSGGAAGWPEPGCRCASCLRQAADGTARERSTIVVDGTVRLGADGPAGIGNEAGGRDGVAGRDGERVLAGGYRVRRLGDVRDGEAVGGWEVTGPDGGRVLWAARPGAVPVPPEGAGRYDAVFLDLLGDPAQLGLLRARGLVTTDTVTAVAFADHRVPSEAELRRRCGFWAAIVPGDGDQVDVPGGGEADSTARSAEKELAGTVLGWSQAGRALRQSGPGQAGPGQAGPWRVLVIGGARSGKSERAELRLAGEPDVTYVATGPNGQGGGGHPADPEWGARVAAHRARRPWWWRTAETTDLAGVLAAARGAVLIDGIGTWLAAVLGECGAWDGSAGWADRLAARTGGLTGAWRQTRARVVAVSDETGLGVVPETPAGRLFRDELGRLNRALAAESEETELVVAGRILRLE
jgi:adenosylcobinamide kinase / adenosylcobinamide-phosphate guanylyltransferase